MKNKLYSTLLKYIKEQMRLSSMRSKKKDKFYKFMSILLGFSGGGIGFLMASDGSVVIKYIWYPLIGQIFIFYWMINKGEKANELLESRYELIEKQKQLILSHQEDIIDSINYAKRLQDAILPPIAEINENLPEHFVLYKPKDIVAGDFYWAEKINDFYFIAAADCTGHGVPGAMVSMVCSNALNRAVNEFGITETGKILDKVRELVLDTFKKSSEEVKDGMDISLCRIDKKNKEIQWSGANNPLWFYKYHVLNEIKADKQPISKFDETKPFTTHSLSFSDKTNLYLFTDGYADQFSVVGKKMTKKRFKDLITSVQDKSMKEQKEIIEKYYDTWKGDTDQIDDVCVLGIRV